jgi:hypothetical protein
MSDYIETTVEFVDGDGDGYAETTLVDSDGDGAIDTVLTDVDGDGYDDVAEFDNVADGEFVADVVAVDTDGDGLADVVADDVDLDGVADEVTHGGRRAAGRRQPLRHLRGPVRRVVTWAWARHHGATRHTCGWSRPRPVAC